MYWLILIIVILLCVLKKHERDLSVSVVIPAYNEEKTVAKVVKAAHSSSYVDEVIVVDDGSFDNTYKEAKRAGAKIIRHASNRGKGAALKTGFKHSKGDIVVFLDADLRNITTAKIDKMIKPIIEGRADITKTKFKRRAGRVTELTAKPLLRFFFPEIKFEQPLSGQFAAKRSVLERMKFEDDYGVDVGIILDADVQGLNVKEVDIGELEHDMASLSDLNIVATEVVRTIVDRALEYGRITMMDSMGESIRMCILGLSLITLGIFSIFFIRALPPTVGIIMGVVGVIIAAYYFVALVKRSYHVLASSKGRLQVLRSFIYMHFPILVSALILVAMISALLGAVHIDEGKISIEPNPGNLIIWKKNAENRTFDVRGPYTIDSALEGENDTIRLPKEAVDTLGLNYGDIVYIGGVDYTLKESRPNDVNIIRIPANAREILDVNVGDVIRDSALRKVFNNIFAVRKISNQSNITIENGILIEDNDKSGREVNIYLDGKKITTALGAMKNGSYAIYINGIHVRTIYFNENSPRENYTIYWGDHIIIVEIGKPIKTNMQFATIEEGIFLNIISDKL
ncbi:glycosyltransferase [Methanothermobacter tenebrarum]|uniref:Dolichyl-phosphate-mannose-protein mannosyltransferase n=1 Tax=Methanothermobacter tenebrarum TaxID=680118 RepID=A0A328PGU5_9EURY|nr:glycosyltransferase [Methanothermobacter tenebrarum]MBC7100750.1 glycosyltransferase [Methanobacteriales archaeon]MBC7117362.1 glycosyltransferase [Methanobacteriaceae archaeon]NPV65432.1 glycosyltransferase [Methanobacteriaceae archaeon]RAO78866.1 dolichyl-phosphate-mannose-protein mannosyltransferase [Methanothermobacter tenebrarum]